MSETIGGGVCLRETENGLCRGRLDPVKDGEGAVIASICLRCRQRYTVRICEVCARPFTRKIDEQGKVCGKQCVKDKAKQKKRNAQDAGKKVIR